MRTFFPAAMLVAVPLAFASFSPASAAMTSASCQPLTSDNLQACCDDANWSTLIQPGDHQFCSRRNAQDTVRLGRKLKSRAGQTSADEDLPTGSVSKPAANGKSTNGSVGGSTSASGGNNENTGNPGNSKDVGNAGEKGMDNGDTPSGTRGNSNNGDSPSGKGN